MAFKDVSDAIIGAGNAVFGEDFTYTPYGSAPVTLRAVFINAYIDTEGIVAMKATLRIRLSDLTTKPTKGDTVICNSVNYRVQESREDGFGGSTLILNKA